MASKKKPTEIKIDNILLNDRKVFLLKELDEDIEDKIIKAFYALDSINHKTIYFYLNSPGGSVPGGINVINTMNTVKSPVNTIISGEVCSMASLISVVGNRRLMYSNSIWMQHPMSGGINGEDYTAFTLDRIEGIKLSDKITENLLKEYTKLNKKDRERLKRGEMWLNAKQCLKKGIIDKII